MLHRRSLLLPASTLALAALAACAEPGALLEPSAAPALNTAGPLTRYVTLCKIGPSGTTATFSVSATGGSLLLGSPVTLNATSLDDTSQCREIWMSVEGQGTSVSVAEVARSAGTELEKIVWIAGDVWYEAYPPQSSVTVDAVNGAVVWFKNKASDRVGGQGCTPGYWKNHLAVWGLTGYAPANDWDTAFGVSFRNPDLTLLQALSLGGGGANRLTRHGAAALLNAAHPLVSYNLSVAEVISLVQGAIASGDYNTAGDLLEEYNEQNTAGFCD